MKIHITKIKHFHVTFLTLTFHFSLNLRIITNNEMYPTEKGFFPIEYYYRGRESGCQL